MRLPLTIIGEMAEGSTGVVLPLLHDPECLRVTWHQTPDLAAEELRQAGCWPVRPLPAEVA